MLGLRCLGDAGERKLKHKGYLCAVFRKKLWKKYGTTKGGTNAVKKIVPPDLSDIFSKYLILFKSSFMRRYAIITQIRRTIECFGLEGTFKGHLVQSLCSEQGCL